ncbi:PIN domain-containing protein, partial [Undibacterium sp.]|uniref:PIN domain-containing protein n=1 Tax=Undibacterium sp. TaxID=1914977 RepID=UPI003750B938
MPLPKMPTKPAALLSPKDYPKADKGKVNQPTIAATKSVHAAATPAATPPATAKNNAKSVLNKARQATSIVKSNTKVATANHESKENPAKSPVSKAADKKGTTKLFVLDTNVLMHDPTSLFRFEEHDVYLPMITLEELDDHKKGMSEVARNARQISRSLDALVGEMGNEDIEKGVALSKLGNKDARGRLFFQTKLQGGSLPQGLPQGKADNQILGVVRALEAEFPGRAIVLVSKDINMRIKARALGLPAEDYFNDHVLEDSDLLY